MSDQQITCAECGSVFVFSAAEQDFYAEKGLAAPPKRCKACRQARRAAQGGGGERDARGPRGRSPRFTGDPNEYRSPMGQQGSPPQGGNGERGERGGNRGGFNGSRGPSSFGSRGGYANGNGGGFARGGGGEAGRFQRPNGGGGGNGYGPPRGDRGRGPGGNGGASSSGNRAGGSFERGGPPRQAWGTRPSEGGNRPPHRPAPRDGHQGESVPAAARARAERPRYDITCAECGTAAQVPFKPLEGRQVFCQPCYRARARDKEPVQTVEGETTSAETSDIDTGIVE
ncbi:MAG TPA: zinc-ribbon domain containing protein [Polyangiaceae bacterium]|jgi:CxxC-x17-CxxC domain-containing protein